jgi:hypothetical protein
MEGSVLVSSQSSCTLAPFTDRLFLLVVAFRLLAQAYAQLHLWLLYTDRLFRLVVAL